MAKKNREEKVPQGKKAKELGYVSFTKEEVKNAEENAPVNQRAYELLYDAMEVSKHVQKKNKKGKVVNDDDIYPTTLAETQRMDELIGQAYDAADDESDSTLMSHLNEMREIVDWSSKRHWNFSWMVIIGVIVSIFYLYNRTGSAKENVERQQQELALMEKWDDPAIMTYKEDRLKKLENNIASYEKYIKDSEAVLDTAVNKDVKKTYQERLKSHTKSKKEYEEDLAKLEKASTKDVHKMAITEKKGWVKNAKGSHRSIYFWTAFFILLTPLYIFAERPFGYSLSRYRTEAKALRGIKKLSLILAGGLASMAAALQITETVTTWSDGSKTTDSDAIPIVAFKIGLLIAAVVVICITSMFLMVYSTITGLIRNYDLIPKTKAMIGQMNNNSTAA
jgi:hypothetical protein